MNDYSANELINELINCSFPLSAIIFDNYCKAYDDVNDIQVSILNLLYDHGTLNMTNLARRLGYTNQRLTQPVDNLVRRNLLVRNVEENNRRVVLISLTGEGRDFLIESRKKAHKKTIELLDAVMDEKEKQELFDCLQRANTLLERLNAVR